MGRNSFWPERSTLKTGSRWHSMAPYDRFSMAQASDLFQQGYLHTDHWSRIGSGPQGLGPPGHTRYRWRKTWATRLIYVSHLELQNPRPGLHPVQQPAAPKVGISRNHSFPQKSKSSCIDSLRVDVLWCTQGRSISRLQSSFRCGFDNGLG